MFGKLLSRLMCSLARKDTLTHISNQFVLTQVLRIAFFCQTITITSWAISGNMFLYTIFVIYVYVCIFFAHEFEIYSIPIYKYKWVFYVKNVKKNESVWSFFGATPGCCRYRSIFITRRSKPSIFTTPPLPPQPSSRIVHCTCTRTRTQHMSHKSFTYCSIVFFLHWTWVKKARRLFRCN